MAGSQQVNSTAAALLDETSVKAAIGDVPSDPEEARLYRESLARYEACRKRIMQAMRARQQSAMASSVVGMVGGFAGPAGDIARQAVQTGISQSMKQDLSC
jgi:hypothetical protein